MKSLRIKGFTLVELAVVIVIIGILITGLLVGQSLINSSKVQAFAAQISQADVAAASFKDSYGALPGDSSVRYATFPGDQDGLLSTSNASSYNGISEFVNFWPVLSSEGFECPENPTTGYLATYSYNPNFPYGVPNAPMAKIGKNSGLLVIGDANAEVYSTAGFSGMVNMYFVANCTGMNDEYFDGCINGVSGADSLSFDAKVDDGIGTTGNVVANTLSNVVESYAMNLSNWVTDSSETNYLKSNAVSASQGYVLIVRMLSNVEEKE